MIVMIRVKQLYGLVWLNKLKWLSMHDPSPVQFSGSDFPKRPFGVLLSCFLVWSHTSNRSKVES